jgi:hypothetical protein
VETIGRVSVEISTEVETYDTLTPTRIVSVLGKTATVRRMGLFSRRDK